jgi:SNF2 family DNA or RNA helicase
VWSLPFQEGIDLRLNREPQSLEVRFKVVPIIELPVGAMLYVDPDSRTAPILMVADGKQNQGDLPAVEIIGQRFDELAAEPLKADADADDRDEKGLEEKSLTSLEPILASPAELTKVAPFIGDWTLRLYQQEAIGALRDTRSLLLADDPGTGKKVSAIAAASALIGRGKAKRALIVCSESMMRHWENQLATWAPELKVNSIRDMHDRESQVWTKAGHVVLVDYRHLGAGFRQGSFNRSHLEFDILILDDALVALHRAELWVAQLKRVNATWRWGLSGSRPKNAQDWSSLFTLLIPRTLEEELKKQIGDPSERYLPFVMQRHKAEMINEMPRWNRQEIWLDLDQDQQTAYLEALAKEQDRLKQMGDSVTHDHIAESLRWLSQVCNSPEGRFDGPKVYALVDRIGAIASNGGKVVVFSQDRRDDLSHLETVLETFGVVRLEAKSDQVERDKALNAIRYKSTVRVLLADPEAKSDGQPLGVSYIIHFDHGFHVAAYRRGEWTFFPEVEPSIPVNVYEFWIANTHDERLHSLLRLRMPVEASDFNQRPLPEWYPELTVDDWLTNVLQAGSQKEQALV